MMVFRIAKEAYKDDISGNGAALYGARWNSPGTKMVYTATHISLAILESLVHLKQENYLPAAFLIKIDVPASIESSSIVIDKLRPSWKEEPDYTQWIGDQFIKNNEALLLKVPSAVVPEETNILINPMHKDFKKIKIISSEKLQLDKRLR